MGRPQAAGEDTVLHRAGTQGSKPGHLTQYQLYCKLYELHMLKEFYIYSNWQTYFHPLIVQFLGHNYAR